MRLHSFAPRANARPADHISCTLCTLCTRCTLPHTIDGHVRNVYTKLHVNNRSGAVAKALKERLL